MTIIATSKNTSHNKTDIWVEAGDINYMLPMAYWNYRLEDSKELIEDFTNEIIFTVKSWGEEDNGVKIANLN